MREKSDAKAVDAITSQAVTTLGLTDIILGGLMLYRKYLSVLSEPAANLPTTGHTGLDIALLVCVAALLGKLLTLVVAAVMAVVNIALRRLKFDKEIADGCVVYVGATGRPAVSVQRRAATAAAVVAIDSGARRSELEACRSHAIIAYGAAYISWSYASSLRAIMPEAAMYAASAAFAVLGVLQQASWFVQLIAFLNAPPVAEKEKNDVK